ncbi:electron transport protein SCO1/SenC [Thiorhodococcus drewsii AZ1]|uniref:Electron transport protein SCO1/SenC n=1 Tax=Thiorhodococcus drewsii AZ1 TaxID=765913 RepID=G2DWY0_9GAMM|nr:SCO family protein [Thiorhodococcus drewsii]EGV33334.1 electron transport protein SCO1/SenC [Thiorhodococcus drewsii AZ1]
MKTLHAQILFRLALATLLALACTHAKSEPIGGDFQLIDQDGRPFSLSQVRGKVVVLSFGYTFCPDICPTTLAVISAALRQLGDQADRVQGIFISLDPDRDTPEKLREYVRYFDARLIGLTGTAKELKEVADRYRVRYAFVGKGEREHYSLDHSAAIYILDTEGRVARLVPYGLPPEEIVETVRGLLGTHRPSG